MALIGAVLTGGRSSRFGSDKALATLGDSAEAMGGRLVRELRDAGCDPVVAVGGEAGHALHVPVVQDRYPGEGPLAGLASVLSWAGQGHVLVVPCDLPLINAKDLVMLINAAREPSNPTGSLVAERAAIAVVAGEPQPSVGCWPAASAPDLLRAVRSGRRAMRASLDLVRWTGVELRAGALLDADDPKTLKHLLDDADSHHSTFGTPPT